LGIAPKLSILTYLIKTVNLFYKSLRKSNFEISLAMNYDLLTDEMLLNYLKHSDKKAFQTIYKRYWQSLFLTAYYKLHSKEVAEEIIQDVFTALWDKRTMKNIKTLEPYLRTAVKYKIITHIKAELLKKNKLDSLLLPYADNLVDNTFDEQELLQAFYKSINLLPAKTREIFILSRVQHCSVKQIALQMNLTEKAVEYHITQSMKRLRILLHEFISLNIFIGCVFLSL
jgi:RNA polymerase sigma-70 factor (ECF subfamily)